MNKKIRRIKGFFVGDVEREGWNWFFRIYYNTKALKKLNNCLNAHLRMDEWITMVVDDEGNYKKIVAFSEIDNFEYNLDKVFTKKIINMFLNQGIEYGLERHIFVKTDNKMNDIDTPLGKCSYKVLMNGDLKIFDSDLIHLSTLFMNEVKKRADNGMISLNGFKEALDELIYTNMKSNDKTSILCLGMEGVYYADSINGLVEAINYRMDEYYPSYNQTYSYVTAEELKQQGLINRVGNNYYVVYGSGYGDIVD